MCSVKSKWKNTSRIWKRTDKSNETHVGNHRVLVLNSGYFPIDVISWEEAINAWATERADIIETYDDFVLHAGVNAITGNTFEMECPSVIRMRNANVARNWVKTLPPTRKNILERDNHECVYCGERLTMTTLTIDHVYPLARGGLSDWYNLRASCKGCNGTKGNKTLSELGWKLRRRVGIPTLDVAAPKGVVAKIGGRIPNEGWRKYITWTITLDEKVREDVNNGRIYEPTRV